MADEPAAPAARALMMKSTAAIIITARRPMTSARRPAMKAPSGAADQDGADIEAGAQRGQIERVVQAVLRAVDDA